MIALKNHNNPALHWSHTPRAKRLSLRVDHKAGLIRLIIPPRTPEFLINRFLNKNQSWIEHHQKSLLTKVNVNNGAVIPVEGKCYIISIHEHKIRTTNISLNDDNIIIKTSRRDPTTNLKRWMIDFAREKITPMAEEKAKTIRKDVSKIDLRDTTTRWGSCSSDKRLMFSWRLIMAPPYVLDYVVAHEVAHLKRMDHSSKFWDICYSLAERPEEARLWLKENGNSLMRYF